MYTTSKLEVCKHTPLGSQESSRAYLSDADSPIIWNPTDTELTCSSLATVYTCTDESVPK